MTVEAKNERAMFRRLQGSERLRALADQSVARTAEERELERLKGYLLEWADHQERQVPKLGYGKSCLADFSKTSQRASDMLAESNGWAMAVIDACIDDLIELAEGTLMRAALRVRYLNEGLSKEAGFKIRVFRSGRLESISLEKADALADRAEIALIPNAKRRGLPL